jgi:Prp8 binding protein
MTILPLLKRTSLLPSPTLFLNCEVGSLLSLHFDVAAKLIATAGMEGSIVLWNIDDLKTGSLVGKLSKPILDLEFMADGSIVAAGADCDLSIFDLNTGKKRKLKGHAEPVNSISTQRNQISSASDDGTLKIWDTRQNQKPSKQFTNEFPLTSTSFSKDSLLVFAGGIDNVIRGYDLRNDSVLYEFGGHSDTITALKVSPDGQNLLSNSMDNSLKIWDIKPYSLTPTRELMTFKRNNVLANHHGYEGNLIRPCWSPCNQFVSCGSGDRSVNVWNLNKKRLVYKLPGLIILIVGHKGCVNEVGWSGGVLASCGSDGVVVLGEINVDEVK